MPEPGLVLSNPRHESIADMRFKLRTCEREYYKLAASVRNLQREVTELQTLYDSGRFNIMTPDGDGHLVAVLRMTNLQARLFQEEREVYMLERDIRFLKERLTDATKVR